MPENNLTDPVRKQEIQTINVNGGHSPDSASSGSEQQHHHHHHHRHHHSDKGWPRIKRKVKRFFKKHKLLPAAIGGILLVLGIAFAVTYSMLHSGSGQPAADGRDYPAVVSEPTVEIEPITEKQVLITDIAAEFVGMRTYSERNSFMMGYIQKGERQDKSLPVHLEFRIMAPLGNAVSNVRVMLSEHEDMSDSRVFELGAVKRSVDVDLLKTNTKYYYKVTASFTGSDPVTAKGEFETADTPRLLSIDGIADVRDIGNIKTVEGRVIRQGLLYRGMAPCDPKQSHYRITDGGLFSMLTVLGVRTDMDLRSEEDYEGFEPLGANVSHSFYNVRQYTEAMEPYGMESTRRVFSDLAKPEIYPVYMHCMLGTDRTGTICALLEALLGASEEDIKTDYELTLLAHSGVQRDLFEQLIGRLQSMEGNSLRQKAERFLLDCGVTPDEIASIREIFLN